MPGHDAEDPREHLYGAQEAARILDIHRSTLSLAVRRKLLLPDAKTPGGHLRFRQETLDAFRTRLRHGSATRGTTRFDPAEILGHVAHVVVTETQLEAICEDAVTTVCNARVGVDMCCVARHVVSARDRHGLRLIAQCGFPASYFDDYEHLRLTMEFAATAVQRTLEPEICEDTARQRDLRAGTAQLTRRAAIRSYVVMPVAAVGEVLAVLVAASHLPRHVGSGDLTMLHGLADQLAVAIQRARQAEDTALSMGARRADAYLAATHALTWQALTLRTGADRLSGSASISQLSHIALDATGAARACALGFGRAHDLDTSDAQLHDLVCRARDGDDLLTLSCCDTRQLGTALAASIPLRDGGRSAVGLSWQCAAPGGHEQHALLVAFGAACALALDL